MSNLFSNSITVQPSPHSPPFDSLFLGGHQTFVLGNFSHGTGIVCSPLAFVLPSAMNTFCQSAFQYSIINNKKCKIL